MGFGKRTAEPLKSQQQAKRSWTSLAALALGLLVILVGAYIQRHAIAAMAFPAALDRMEVADGPIRGDWKTDMQDPSDGDVVTYRMLAHIMRICGNPQPWKREVPDSLAARKFAQEFDRQPNVYGDPSLTVGEKAVQLEADKDAFCAKEQHVALHDGRLANKGYVARAVRAIEEEGRIVQLGLENLRNVLDDNYPDSSLTEPQKIARRCKKAGSGKLITDCIIDTMVVRQMVDPAVLPDLKARIAKSGPIRESMR